MPQFPCISLLPNQREWEERQARARACRCGGGHNAALAVSTPVCAHAHDSRLSRCVPVRAVRGQALSPEPTRLCERAPAGLLPVVPPHSFAPGPAGRGDVGGETGSGKREEPRRARPAGPALAGGGTQSGQPLEGEPGRKT